MGAGIAAHETYMSSLFEPFNLRFGPPQMQGMSLDSPAAEPGLWQFGGIHEIAALQKQFEIFRTGRTFLESAALLGLTGFVSGPAKDRWVSYLSQLPTFDTDDPKMKADEYIVSGLIKNFNEKVPLPCHMRPQDGRLKEPGLVTMSTDTPVFFMDQIKFLTINMPMRPARTTTAR